MSRPLRPDHVPRDSDHLHHERRRSPHIIQSHDLSGPNRRKKRPDGYAPGADERHRYLSVVDGLPSSSRVARQLRTTASRKGNRRYRRESHATALRVKPLTLSPILVFEAWPASFTPSPPRRVMSRAALDRPMVQNALYLSLLVGETCCSRDSGLLQLTPRPSNSGWTYSPKMTNDIVRKTISRSSTKEALRTYQTSSAALPAVEIARPPMPAPNRSSRACTRKPRGIGGRLVDRQQWPRTDERPLATEDIEKLRKLVKTHAFHESPDG